MRIALGGSAAIRGGLLGLALLCLAACIPQPLIDLGEGVQDDDGDGWFTNATNQRVILDLVDILPALPGQGYAVVVDDVWFPMTDSLIGTLHRTPGQTVPMQVNIRLAQRAVGAWRLDEPDYRVEFESTIRLYDTLGAYEETLSWSNEEETFQVTFDDGTVANLATRIEMFPDPSPFNRCADVDDDAITDEEEAVLASRGVALGDPTRPDILLVVGWTHPDWKLTRLSRERLMSRFRREGFNLYIADAPGPLSDWIEPGQVHWEDGSKPDRDHSVAQVNITGTSQSPGWREMQITGFPEQFAHFAVLAQRVGPIAQWGYSSVPNLWIQSQLPGLGADAHWYQAKLVMHELGHNLGLCHPSDCPPGTLPDAELHPGGTVMGTPGESGEVFFLIPANVLARPLNYSPTQWVLADLTRVRASISCTNPTP